jgi:hypothetical protein
MAVLASTVVTTPVRAMATSTMSASGSASTTLTAMSPSPVLGFLVWGFAFLILHN